MYMSNSNVNQRGMSGMFQEQYRNFTSEPESYNRNFTSEQEPYNRNFMSEQELYKRKLLSEQELYKRKLLSEQELYKRNFLSEQDQIKRNFSSEQEQYDNYSSMQEKYRNFGSGGDSFRNYVSGQEPLRGYRAPQQQVNFERGLKRTLEFDDGDFPYNENRDKFFKPDQNTTVKNANSNKPTAEQGAARLAWDARWTVHYPTFRMPSSYKNLHKWDKCLQPKNAIQILNQMVTSGVEITCPLDSKFEGLGVTQFTAHAKIDGKVYYGTGASKKLAHQSAAENALKSIFKTMLNNVNPDMKKESYIVDVNDLVAWNYITSFALYKLLFDLQHYKVRTEPEIINIPEKEKPISIDELPTQGRIGPYRLLSKLKPDIVSRIQRITQPNDPINTFEVVVDGKVYTETDKNYQTARMGLCKKILKDLFEIIYVDENNKYKIVNSKTCDDKASENTNGPDELPSNALQMRPHVLLYKMKPGFTINQTSKQGDFAFVVEAEVNGQRYTESGTTYQEARKDLCKQILNDLYGLVYPDEQNNGNGPLSVSSESFVEYGEVPEGLPPGALQMDPCKLLLKLKPNVEINRISLPGDQKFEFEAIINGERVTASAKLFVNARRAICKKILNIMYGLVYPEEINVEPGLCSETETETTAIKQLPPKAAQMNAYKLLLRLRPSTSFTLVSQQGDNNFEFEVVINGQHFTELGRTFNGARKALCRKVLSALYGVEYPNKQNEDGGNKDNSDDST